VTTLNQIENAISNLPPEDFRKLADWIEEKRATGWDHQIEHAAKAGKLDGLWEKAKKEIAAGKARPLDELLDD
jgi:hypothetical protein